MYREEGKLKWTSVIYNIQTNTGASQNDTKLTKFTSGTDNEYYVVYLPANIEGEDGAKNYNLTSGGLHMGLHLQIILYKKINFIR